LQLHLLPLLLLQVNMTITRFDSSGIEFIAQETNPFFVGSSNTRTIVNTRHTWQDTSSGLLLKTQQAVGLMEAGSDSVFDTSLIAPVTNLIIKEQYLDKAVNVPKGNITAAAWMAALHYSQVGECYVTSHAPPYNDRNFG
jgi:hypothetical protein